MYSGQWVGRSISLLVSQCFGQFADCSVDPLNSGLSASRLVRYWLTRGSVAQSVFWSFIGVSAKGPSNQGIE